MGDSPADRRNFTSDTTLPNGAESVPASTVTPASWATAAASAMSANGDASADKADDSAAQAAEAAARSKAQFEAMKQQAQRVESIRAEMHVDTSGVVISSQTTLK